MKRIINKLRARRDRRQFLAGIYRFLDKDDAMIVDALRHGQDLPPLKEGLFIKAPQWELHWNL
jgi:hypothetical protein